MRPLAHTGPAEYTETCCAAGVWDRAAGLMRVACEGVAARHVRVALAVERRATMAAPAAQSHTSSRLFTEKNVIRLWRQGPGSGSPTGGPSGCNLRTIRVLKVGRVPMDRSQ